MNVVKVYTTPICQKCDAVMEYLNEMGISYIEIDITESEANRQELVKKGFSGVPITEYNGKTVVGFDQDKLVELLEGKMC